MTSRDTIAAIATPPGIGGVGLIRISGPAAEGIAMRLFRPLPPAGFLSHHLYHGEIVSPDTGAVLDEVLISFLRGPRSYTGEDTLEISCHGGPLILRTVLEEVLRAGARPAERGGFTKRAFLNNRLDLSQAEAILDVISAKTEKGLSRAVGRLKGELELAVGALREHILDTLAVLEVAIDFSEEDLVGEAPSVTAVRLEGCLGELERLLATYRSGRIHQDGLHVLIMGKPNAGKSSLLNALLGTDRAIVTPIPGTTRDFIEESMLIGGIPVTLMDTAGIREPADLIEEEGIARVWHKLEKTDLILMVFDGSRDLDADDLLVLERTRPYENCIAVINKADLPQRLAMNVIAINRPTLNSVSISAKYKMGLTVLEEEMGRMAVLSGEPDADTVAITNLRHFQALTAASNSLLETRESLLSGKPPEIVSLELREALGHLDEITGRALPDEVLDRIFSEFCIGK